MKNKFILVLLIFSALEITNPVFAYQYVGNDPINNVDPLGLSTVRITSNGKTITLIDPSGAKVRETIAALPNGSISAFGVSGHGNADVMILEAGVSGDALELRGGTVVFDDNGSSFADAIKAKLAKNASILLNGCKTANENVEEVKGTNISKELSKELPGVPVTGNSWYGAGNELSNPFNRDQYIRLGRENHVIGSKRTYLNGQQK